MGVCGICLAQGEHEHRHHDGDKTDGGRCDPEKRLAVELDEEGGEDQPHQRDDQVRPEALLVVDELAEGEDAVLVGGEDSQHREGHCDDERPFDAKGEMLPVPLEGDGGHHGHNQEEHEKPAGVVGVVEGREGAV